MWGAVIGDIIGPVYEARNIKTKDFPLFSDRCRFTDDSVCTIAIADALINKKPPQKALKEWGLRYKDVQNPKGFFDFFFCWVCGVVRIQ